MLFLYREALLGQLSVYIKQTRDEFRNKTSGREEVTKQKNFPDSVNNISWVRALEIKVSISMPQDGFNLVLSFVIVKIQCTNINSKFADIEVIVSAWLILSYNLEEHFKGRLIYFIKCQNIPQKQFFRQ